ncbi:MAG: UDP-N-acetylglucosamine 4,6-dehydratase (inverting) [Kiritimatiellaeota bacterium]|nr:UDP-N-acetylglucosamine 4,6-dehydratase (inverting) [Kiritimatiellota bacterium]
MFDNANILITGGTGSFGRKTVKTLLEKYKPNKIIVFSRDELKQFEMSRIYPNSKYDCMRYFIGDVRDPARLLEAFHKVDYVIHAAALKQVPACEYNPFEAVMTNVMGAQNIIRAAIAQRVKKVIALSTDKAASPVNLYGATKLCSDKLFIAGNLMSGDERVRFSVVRYGNVVGSRGSVIPFFLNQRKDGFVTVTDDRMTRFSISLQRGVDFVLENFDRMHGGELFIPKIPSYKILDVAVAAAPNAKIEMIGIRPGEKLHEMMISEDDARRTLEFDDHFIIQPDFTWWSKEEHLLKIGGKPCVEGFSYKSDNNTEWLDVEQLKSIVADFIERHAEYK